MMHAGNRAGHTACVHDYITLKNSGTAGIDAGSDRQITTQRRIVYDQASAEYTIRNNMTK